jgi:probable rRNA maturation factor
LCSPFFFPNHPACPEAKPVILERRKTKEISRLALARFANQAQRAVRLSGEVNILLTSDSEIQRLNREFRHKDTPTDVLSFPAAAPEAGGDIAISLQTARRQAAEAGHELLTEVKVLILHGMLHLAGHDHESDHGQMLRLEQRLRAGLNLRAGLIERTLSADGLTGKATRNARRNSARKPARSRRP